MANAEIKKKKKRKREKERTFTGMRCWPLKRLYIFLWPYLTKSSTTLFFIMYVLSQTLMNVVRSIPLKWTNAIRTHLALIPRAPTTGLAILRLWEMVLVVNVSLVFEGDEIFILFPTLNVAVNCLEFTFTSRRHNFTLRFVHKNESTFDYVLNDFKTLHEL